MRGKNIRLIRRIRQIRPNIRLRTWIALGLILILLPIVFLSLFRPSGSQAEWFDEGWAYRKKIIITNNTSQESNVYIAFDGIDVLDTSASGRFQADCGDIRFSKVNGQLLPYYINSGCGTSSTDIDVFFDTFPAGAQVIYMYYGNPSVDNGFESSGFTTEAINYSIGSVGSEEVGPGPVAWWKFDEGIDNTCSGGVNDFCDATSNGNDLQDSITDYYTEDMCVSGMCVSFGGYYLMREDDSDFDFSTSDSFTITAWFRHSTASAQETILNKYETIGADGGFSLYMEADGDITCGVDTDNSSFPLDSATSTAANYDDMRWHHVACVKNGSTDLRLYIDGVQVAIDNSLTGTGTYANDDYLLVGVAGDYSSNLWYGFLDEIKVYAYARTADQIRLDYSTAGAVVLDPMANGFQMD